MPSYDPARHHRRSIRLPGYDYTQPGAYFVTIVTHCRTHVFGEVVDGDMRLNAWGDIVRDEWFKTAQIRPYVQLRDDEFVVMPNHIHGIIWIVGDHMVGARRRRAPTPDIPTRADHIPEIPTRADHIPDIPTRADHTPDIPTRADHIPEIPTRADHIPEIPACADHIPEIPACADHTPEILACADHIPEIHTMEQFGKPVPGSIPTILRSFKSAVTKRINKLCSTPGAPIWQRNYYEHIIRHERALNAIRHYITDNPRRWHLDRENPHRTGSDPLAREIWMMLQEDDRCHAAEGDR
ncbi:MAG: transposase [Roseiflexus sp.]|nr:transposase [Roseiflexus sp.]